MTGMQMRCLKYDDTLIILRLMTMAIWVDHFEHDCFLLSRQNWYAGYTISNIKWYLPVPTRRNVCFSLYALKKKGW